MGRSTVAQRTATRSPSDLDYKLTLADFFPIKPPSARNMSYGTDIHKRMAQGGYFFQQTSLSTVQTVMAEFKLSERPRRLRERLTEDLQVATRSTRPRRRNHTQWGERVGDAMEYERFRSGVTREQHFWERRERAEHKRQGVVTIHANVEMHAAEDAASLEWTGATCLALADKLEALGYRVAIRGVGRATGNSKNFDVAVTLKDADERLSENAMAYLCHGGVWRILNFTFQLSQEDVTMTYGLGRAEDYRGSLKADITIPRSVRNEQAAEQYIEQVMEEYRDDE